ncbi:MAG: MlaD family protein [Candidatus Cloacimonetes bacterium]|nr:MlaD family protein [Candidatus Cloacimonadota bacterium]
MSYKIKYAKQIVFTFIGFPLIVLIAALVFIAIRQNLLEKKYVYHSTVANALGISTQTPVLYRGFEVGRVRNFSLEDDGNIGIEFYVLKRYNNIMVKGSTLVRSTNPITNKTTLEFIRDPLSQTPIPVEGNIPSSDFKEGMMLLKRIAPQQSDPIAAIISNLAVLTRELNQDNNADQGAIPRLIVNMADASEKANAGLTQAQAIMSELIKLSQNLNRDNNAESGVLMRMINNLANLSQGLNDRLNEVDSILKGMKTTLNNYSRPDSLLIKMLDPNRDLLLTPLSNTLNSLTGATEELGNILGTINNPELRLLLNNLNQSLAKARNTLEALNNNPILRKGIAPSQPHIMPPSERMHEVPDAH